MGKQDLETATHVDATRQIRSLRGQRVLLDSDLAALYGVTTKAFNQAVRRNIDRFPSDFVLQLTEAEAKSSRSQTVTLKPGRGQHRKYPPLAFTEHGCLMLSNVLRSSRAMEVSVLIVRAFVQLSVTRGGLYPEFLGVPGKLQRCSSFMYGAPDRRGANCDSAEVRRLWHVPRPHRG